VLDFDGLWHIPTYVLGAALATAELTEATGEQVVEAFVVGAEVASRLREAIDALREQRRGPTYRGWYHVSVYGPIAAAVTASKLLGLDVDQTRAAIGIAANGAGGVRQNLGTTAKSLLSGNPASHGVHAALLARRGVAGDPDILEARVGLIGALCLPGECDWEPIFSELGNAYVLAAGPDIKRFPSVGPTQAVIMTLMKMRSADSFELGEIESVRARLSQFSAHADYPEDPLMAGFSWPYVLAASLVDGSFSVNHLTPDSIGNPVIRATAELLEFVNTVGDEPEALTVTLNDGRTIHRDVDPGLQLENSEGAVMNKYDTCAVLHLDGPRANALKELVMTLESQPRASALALAIG
jgi:2-methylcitrate dehydratase PrpD